MSNLEFDHITLHAALRVAVLSRDPSTQVGAVIVRDGLTIGRGCNSFPIGIAYTDDRLHDRELKLKLMVHAEMVAILDAARRGNSCHGATLFLACTDPTTNKIWGGSPCIRCAMDIIQSGILEIVSWPLDDAFPRWRNELSEAKALLEEAHVNFRVIDR